MNPLPECLHNSTREKKGPKKGKKQFRCFTDASSCQWLSVSYLSQSPSFSFSLCLALAQDRACRWHCFQLGRQLASVPLTKGYSHRLLGSESNHTSLTNHRASSSWCNHSHTDTDAHTHSHTPHTRTHTNRHTYTDAQSYARTALTFLSPLLHSFSFFLLLKGERLVFSSSFVSSEVEMAIGPDRAKLLGCLNLNFLESWTSFHVRTCWKFFLLSKAQLWSS